MKKYYYFLLIIPIFLLCSCDFVSYQQNVVVNAKLVETRNHYIGELEQLSSLDSYFETEKTVYQLALLEGINQLNECESLYDLESIFNDNKKIILNIKTIAEYERELESKRQDYIGQLKNITNEANYFEKEKNLYIHYLNQGIEKLNQAEVNNLKGIYETYKNEIDKIKKKEVYILEWQTDFSKQVQTYVELDDYREKERKSIQELILNYQQKLKESTEFDQMENLVRDFKTKVYEYETNITLYEKELQQLKQDSILELEEYKLLGDYRNQEQKMICEYNKSFDTILKSIFVKEEVATILSVYKSILDSLKTDKQYYQEEKQALIVEGITSLKEIFTEVELAQKVDYFDTLYSQLSQLETKEAITEILLNEKEKLYIELAESGNVEALNVIKEICFKRIDNYVDLNNYRVDEQDEIKQLKEETKNIILQTDTYADTMACFKDCFEKIDLIKTNDELWKIEDEVFVENFQNKYNTHLNFPVNLVQADSLFELADILDFYAFYQLDGKTFERDTFRVKVTFDYKDLRTLKTKLFYTSELISNTCDFELSIDNTQNIQFKLIAYDYNSKHLELPKPVNYNNLFYFNSDKKSRVPRTENFNDFGYYNNINKEVLVWNSQQLWYAIEHDYIPVPIKNSAAEIVLKEAKNILREIITDDMSNEEKIFSIYTWIAYNTQTAWGHELIEYYSTSGYIEGALFDGVSTCQGITKLYILLLGLEGIKGYLIWEEHPDIMQFDHCWAYILMQDGLFYRSEPYFGMEMVDSRPGLSLAHLLAPCYEYQTTTAEKFKRSNQFHQIYNHILYEGKKCFFNTKEELIELLDLISQNNEKGFIYIAYLSQETNFSKFEEILTTYSFNYFFPRTIHLSNMIKNAIIYFD